MIGEGLQELTEVVDSAAAWDWQAFWPELAAGLITFGLGIPFAFYLLTRQFSQQRSEQAEEFRNLATEVLGDLANLEALLQQWTTQVEAGQPAFPLDPPPLTWDMGENQIQFIFATRGVHKTTQQAVDWFREAAESVKSWNSELGGVVSDKTAAIAASQTQFAIEKVRRAAAELDSALGTQ